MYFRKRLRMRNTLGFSLVELIVVVLVVSVVSAIAIPRYMAAKSKGYMNIAQTDGGNLFREIRNATMDIQTPGTSNGTITFNVSTGTMTITFPGGSTLAPFTQNVSVGTTVTGVTYANTFNWCIDVLYNSQHAVFDQDGYRGQLVVCP